MRYRFLIPVFLLITSAVYSSDSLQISFTKKTFVKGDSIEFKCVVPHFAELNLQGATLNVWIEDVEKTKRWKYRYPMINGEVSASLAVSDKISDGRYAINFLVQRGFLRVTGSIKNYDKRDSVVNYMMIQKNKTVPYFDNMHVAGEGNFRLKSILFADSAYFAFSPVKKTKNNYFLIRLETQLDSAFVPVLEGTQFITVGDPKMLVSAKTDTSAYAFQVEDQSDPTLLPGVTVTSKFKKKVDQYNAEYSRGLFDNADAIMFDGLESDEISRSTTIQQFLQNKVAGLTLDRGTGGDAAGEEILRWRDEPVQIYIDEFLLDPRDPHIFITPKEVAMIKVYRPPAHVGGEFSLTSGAIAIYTKKGAYADNYNKSGHNFIVKGYTNFESTWQ